MALADMGVVLGVGGKEPDLDDESCEVDLGRLSAADREAILARVAPDDSAPPDAYALAQNEIRREMIDRGIQPKGFYNDDAARLQEEFDREHEAEREARMQQKLQMAARSYLKETVHRRRQERERELREEAAEVARSPQLEVWLSLAKAGAAPAHAALRVSSVGARALCKALALSHSLRSLTLSRNALGDAGGRWVALLVRRSRSLARLELDSAGLGPPAARELADALTANASVAFLSLESNPLTDDEKDVTGVAALADMLTRNQSLRALSLWRTRLGAEAGKLLARGLERNGALVCLDVGNNRVADADAAAMDRCLRRNREQLARQERERARAKDAQAAAADKERARQMDVAKQRDHEEWMAQRKKEREEDRAVAEEQRQRALRAEEDRLRQIAARKAAEFAARVELERKKKAKKGGGGAKKKKK